MQSLMGTEARPNIKVPIPGPNAQKIVDKDHEWVATTTKTSPIAGKRGIGSVVEDVDGNILLDFTAGIGVVNLGHCHPAVNKAVQEQMASLVHFAGTDFYYEVQAELARRLAEKAPGAKRRKVFYTNSGAESVEAAIKVAKWSADRRQFLAFQGAFHGRTAGAGSLTASKPVQRARFFPTMPGVTHVPYANPYRNVWGIDGYDEPEELVSRTIGYLEDFVFKTHLPPDEVAAFFTEPVQGEGGYIVPPKGFYKRLKGLCEDHGILYVADEVQTGFGRTGKWFGIEHEEVEPDIMTLAKGIANGFPMGACVFDAELDFGVKGAHSNTYGGNLISCTAALTVMDVLEKEPIFDNVEARGKELKKGLMEIQEDEPRVGDVRGRGLMVCADFVTDPKTKGFDTEGRDKMIEASWKRGLMLLPCGKSGIRFIPPLVVSQEQVEGALEVFRDAVKAVYA
ncbi:MAG: acetyl ornithine aminotransferase family protein [Euryarchaeota archaeon]|nr:acetyl ornithine aminotransferase family protein [Euryarchaeota archaeon]